MAEVITMPKLGFDMREGTLVRWVKQEGETVEKGQVIAEIETDKATVEVEAYTSGVLRKTLAAAGAVLPIGDPIAIIGTADEVIDLETLGIGKPGAKKKARAGSAPAAAAPTPASPPQAGGSEGGAAATGAGANGRVIASPIARRIADERGIDLRLVPGSGPGGRITRKDVEAAAGKPAAAAPAAAPAAISPPQAGGIEGEAGDTTRPLTRIRQIIARRMVEAKQQVPHFYVTSEIDMAAAMALRQQANGWLDDAHKLSVNDLIVKAAATVLRDFPALNSSFAGDQVIVHAHVNIGIAVALAEGLTTVVVRDADRKPLSQIAAESKAAIERARAGKTRSDDMEGSTFTVSNLGMFDVEHFIGIVNPPEAALLALGSVREVPVVQNGQLAVGLRMQATLSADHRVTDGAEVAKFLQAFKRALESPLRMIV
jgi:pyruvate dehydrogenase E2 component (dihydrolipoamide acetyltransferase)